MTDQPDIHALTGAYALDALDADERELFEAHLASCEPCAREVDELRETVAHLHASAYEPPPAAMRDDVLARIDAVPQEPTPDVPTGPDVPAGPGVSAGSGAAAGAEVPDEPEVVDLDARRTVPRWVAGVAGVAAAVLAAAVVGMGAVVTDLSGQLSEAESAAQQLEQVLATPDATTVATEGPDDAVARVVASPSRGEAVLLSHRLEEAPHGHTYEAWLIDDTGATSVGLFDPDEDGRAVHVVAGDIADSAALGVTVEPEGGSPEPTTDPIWVFELE